MLKYFLEIKYRLILLIFTWFSWILTSYIYKETLLFIIVQPYTNITTNEHLAFFYFIFTDVTEVLSVYLKLITFSSFQILYFYLIYHFFLFLGPAFFKIEYYYLKLGIIITVFGWFFCAILIIYILIPLTLNFFLGFQNLTVTHSFNLHFEAKIYEYISFCIEIYFLCELYFQFLILFILFLNYINVNTSFIKKFRKCFHYFFILFSTFISPPEVLSQILISFFLICIYELLLIYIFFKICLKWLIN